MCEDEKLTVNFDNSYQEIYQKAQFVRGNLERFLQDYLQTEDKKLSITNRIKSKRSIQDKLSRKGYSLNMSSSDLSEYIHDFVGFRVGVDFLNEEENIFNNLLNYLKQKEEIEIIEPDEDELKQSNGHKIFKFKGVVLHEQVKIGFEIQVKSSVHNLWGDVEHSIVYKPRDYNFNIGFQKELIENIYNTLDSADKQLYHVKEDALQAYSEIQLLQQLFYLKTRGKAFEENDYTHQYYDWFFKIFEKEINLEKLFSELVLNKEITPREIENDKVSLNNKEIDSIKDIICEILKLNEIEKLLEIIKICFKDFDSEKVYNYISIKTYKEYQNPSGGTGHQEQIKRNQEEALLMKFDDYDDDDDNIGSSEVSSFVLDKNIVKRILESYHLPVSRYQWGKGI